jgi:hypothetical protein
MLLIVFLGFAPTFHLRGSIPERAATPLPGYLHVHRGAVMTAWYLLYLVQTMLVVYRKLKARAAIAGQSLSDYLLAEINRVAARPTREEMLARIHSRTRVTLKTPAAVVIREERGSGSGAAALVTCDGSPPRIHASPWIARYLKRSPNRGPDKNSLSNSMHVGAGGSRAPGVI